MDNRITIPANIGSMCEVKAPGRYAPNTYNVYEGKDGAAWAIATNGRIAGAVKCEGAPPAKPARVNWSATSKHGVSLDLAAGTYSTVSASGKLSKDVRVLPPAEAADPMPPIHEVAPDDPNRTWFAINANLLHTLASAIGSGRVVLGVQMENGAAKFGRAIAVIGLDDELDATGWGAIMPIGQACDDGADRDDSHNRIYEKLKDDSAGK